MGYKMLGRGSLLKLRTERSGSKESPPGGWEGPASELCRAPFRSNSLFLDRTFHRLRRVPRLCLRGSSLLLPDFLCLALCLLSPSAFLIEDFRSGKTLSSSPDGLFEFGELVSIRA